MPAIQIVKKYEWNPILCIKFLIVNRKYALVDAN